YKPSGVTRRSCSTSPYAFSPNGSSLHISSRSRFTAYRRRSLIRLSMRRRKISASCVTYSARKTPFSSAGSSRASARNATTFSVEPMRSGKNCSSATDAPSSICCVSPILPTSAPNWAPYSSSMHRAMSRAVGCRRVPRRSTKGSTAFSECSSAFRLRRSTSFSHAVLNLPAGATYRPIPWPMGTFCNSMPAPGASLAPARRPFAPAGRKARPVRPRPALQHDGHFVAVHPFDALQQLGLQQLVLAAREAHLPQQVDAPPQHVYDVAFVLIRPAQQPGKLLASAPPVGQLRGVVVEAHRGRPHPVQFQLGQALDMALHRFHVKGVVRIAAFGLARLVVDGHGQGVDLVHVQLVEPALEKQLRDQQLLDVDHGRELAARR